MVKKTRGFSFTSIYTFLLGLDLVLTFDRRISHTFDVFKARLVISMENLIDVLRLYISSSENICESFYMPFNNILWASIIIKFNLSSV